MIHIDRPIVKSGLLSITLLSFASVPAVSQLSYSGCPNVTTADFDVVPLVNNAMDNTVQEPMKMALIRNAAGNVDVYFTQRFGRVRKYDGTTGVTSTLANLNLTLTASFTEGLHGIALDPNFPGNNWMYLYTAVGTNWQVTRYTVAGAALNMTSAKVIWQYTATAVSQHAAGALRFDQDGNFWITVADGGGATTPANFSATNPYLSANTNLPNGKILRIRLITFPDNQTPTPGVGGTYTIPAGNLFAPGTALTLPEIYVMGTRNPFTIDFDTERHAMSWGDVGPDAGAVTEEHNMTTTPGNYGWPYWAGNQIQQQTGGGTPGAPMNTHATNTGLTNLPVARPPLNAYNTACAVTGPVYYYNGGLNSTVKFPPHFNGAWVVGDFNNEWIDVLGLNTDATAMTGRQRIVTAASSSNVLNALMELQMGPDGALYVVNYSGYRSFDARSGILRIEYNGTCRPVTGITESLGNKPFAEFDGIHLSVNRGGFHSFEVRNLEGQLEMRGKGNSPTNCNLNEIRTPGMHLLTVKTSQGVLNRKFIR